MTWRLHGTPWVWVGLAHPYWVFWASSAVLAYDNLKIVSVDIRAGLVYISVLYYIDLTVPCCGLA